MRADRTNELETLALVAGVVPACTDQQLRDAILYFRQTIARPLGMTQIFDAGE